MNRWFMILRITGYVSGLAGLLLFMAARRNTLSHPAWAAVGGALILLMGLAFMGSFALLFLSRLQAARPSRRPKPE